MKFPAFYEPEVSFPILNQMHPVYILSPCFSNMKVKVKLSLYFN